MIKLIASDVDGTLIKDSTPDLYPEMVEVIRKLKERNVLFCAASGRQYASLRNVFREVAEDIAYIAENGAHIRYRDENISVVPMKRQDVEDLMTALRPYYGKCETIISTAQGSLIESKDKDFLDLMTYGYRNSFRQVEDVLAEPVDIIKIAIYCKGSIRSLGENILIPAFCDRLKACMAGEEWVDFMDKSVDKGNALKALEQYLGVSREETIAFGDNNNDIGMMQAAGKSYAVENAVEEVKAAADEICPGWRNKGVALTLEKLFQF